MTKDSYTRWKEEETNARNRKWDFRKMRRYPPWTTLASEKVHQFRPISLAGSVIIWTEVFLTFKIHYLAWNGRRIAKIKFWENFSSYHKRLRFISVWEIILVLENFTWALISHPSRTGFEINKEWSDDSQPHKFNDLDKITIKVKLALLAW